MSCDEEFALKWAAAEFNRAERGSAWEEMEEE
jgi:hypothetical protein